MKVKLNKYYSRIALLLLVLIAGLIATLIPLLLVFSNHAKANENRNLVITQKLSSINEAKCYKDGKTLVCKNGIIKIINEVPEVIDEYNTKQLLNWFMEKVSYGPEILLLDSIILSKSRCNSKQELNCNAETRFFDSKKSKIILYPYSIIKGEEYISEPLMIKPTFHYLTYFLAHEYYHHVTQQQFYDLVLKGLKDPSRIAVDATGKPLPKNKGNFTERRSKIAIDTFLSINRLDLEVTNDNSRPVDGIYSRNCPLNKTTRNSIYNWANKQESTSCLFSWKFPPFETKKENEYYPKNALFIRPPSLMNCGYFATNELPAGNVVYYFSLDEIAVRQLVQLTYIEGSSKQPRQRIACNLPLTVRNKKIGENNDFLLDYYLLSKMGFSLFNNNQNYSYEKATNNQKKEQEKTNTEMATALFKMYFQTNLDLSSLMYNPIHKEYSLGGYLKYNEAQQTFVKNFEGRMWAVNKIVAINTITKKKSFLNMKKRHNLYYVNHFNAINPLTRIVDEKNQISRLNNRYGYATDWFLPSKVSYKLYFQGKLDGREVLIPISNQNNKTIWTNHGEDPEIRRFKLEFNEKDKTYNAIFND